jgi:hypothetical protein
MCAPHVCRRLLLTLAAATTAALAAERVAAQDVSLGGRLGLVGGAVWFEDDEANNMEQPMAGLQVGGVAAFRPGSIISLQTELWFVQKGWTETPAGGGRRLSYLELPLFLTATAPWRTAPQVLAGISAGYELACSVTSVAGGGAVGCDDPRVAWQRSKTQLATWVGLGVRQRMGGRYLQIQLLSHVNLTDVNRDPLPRGHSRLFSLSLSAAYVIPVGGAAR